MKSKSAALPCFIWMIIFTIVPLGMVLYFAFTNANGAFTMENIAGIVPWLPTFGKSIALGAISTVICLVLGYPIAYIMSRMKEKYQQTMVMLIMLPMWMNFLLRTYAWMTLIENNGLINRFLALFGIGPLAMINTQGAIVLGMVYNFLPYMILPLYSIMTKLDRQTIEAAEDLGANSFQIFRRIVFPLSMPGIISGITMVFVPAVSTFIISKLLGGGSEMLIGDAIEMYFLGGAGDINYNIGAALSLVLMILILLSMGIMNKFDDEESTGGLMI